MDKDLLNRVRKMVANRTQSAEASPDPIRLSDDRRLAVLEAASPPLHLSGVGEGISARTGQLKHTQGGR